MSKNGNALKDVYIGIMIIFAFLGLISEGPIEGIAGFILAIVFIMF